MYVTRFGDRTRFSVLVGPKTSKCYYNETVGATASRCHTQMLSYYRLITSATCFGMPWKTRSTQLLKVDKGTFLLTGSVYPYP